MLSRVGFRSRWVGTAIEEFFQKIHPDDQAASRERFEKAIRDKADFELDYRIVHPDKGVRDIHAVGHAVLDRCGDLCEFVGTVIDITARKRAEDNLRRAFEDIKALRDEIQKRTSCCVKSSVRPRCLKK